MSHLDYTRDRELVRLRYELRGLMAERKREQAARLLERLRQIAAEEASEAPTLEPEIARWASSFDL